MLHDRLHARADRRHDPALRDRRASCSTPRSACASRSASRWSPLIMVAIAENARIPVDNPATHLELTMVHEAMVLEYSGRHLAMIEAAAALKLLLYFSLHRLPVRAVRHGAGRRRACAPMRSASPPISRKLARRRLPARRVRDRDRQDARVPRARVPRRGADARPARHAAAVRVAEPADGAALPSTSRTCSPAAWCWSASCCSTRTACSALLNVFALHAMRAVAVGRLAGAHPGRAASLRHRRRSRWWSRRIVIPVALHRIVRAPRHPPRDRDGGRRRPRPCWPASAWSRSSIVVMLPVDRGRRSAGARGPRLRARR